MLTGYILINTKMKIIIKCEHEDPRIREDIPHVAPPPPPPSKNSKINYYE